LSRSSSEKGKGNAGGCINWPDGAGFGCLFVFLQWLAMSNQTEPVANIAVSCTRGSERRGDDG
jgi:hypothetical protein